MGDFANIEIRSRDVFSLKHFPLLGTSSSVSKVLGIEVNHPGPMLFLYAAPIVKIFGGAAGLAIAAASLNGLSIVSSSLLGYRIRGRMGSLSAVFIASVLAWVLGNDLLTSIWNPYPLVLPCFVMFLLAWGVATGQTVFLPWLVLVGSFCVQTHVGYVYVVLGTCTFACISLIFNQFKARNRGENLVNGGRHWSYAAVAMAGAWLLPVIEQIFGEGNLGRLLSAAGKDTPSIGVNYAMRIVSAVEVFAPWWNRTGLSEAIPSIFVDPSLRPAGENGLPGLATSFIVVVVITAALLFQARIASRQRDHVLHSAFLFASILIPLAVLACAGSAPTFFGTLSASNFLWLWPIGAFISFVLLIRLTELSWIKRHAKKTITFVSALVLLISLVNIPVFHHREHLSNESIFERQGPVLESIISQLNSTSFTGSVVVDTTNEPFNCPYYSALMAYLQRRGIDFNVTRSESLAHRQMGPQRAVTGSEISILHIDVGRIALKKKRGYELIAQFNPLSGAEIKQLYRLEQELTRHAGAGDISIIKQVLAEPNYLGPSLSRNEVDNFSEDPELFRRTNLILSLFENDALEVSDQVRDILSQLHDLREKLDEVAVSVYAEWNQ